MRETYLNAKYPAGKDICMGKLILTIVIPTKNRADLLTKALGSIEKQPTDQAIFEVIIIDNGSTDETRDAVKAYKGKIKNLRYFYDARPGLHVGRNRGLLESRGELVGYLDDDVILFPNWINAVLTAFEDNELMYVGGSVIPYDMSVLTPEFRVKYEMQKGRYKYIPSLSCFWEPGLTENDIRVHEAENFFGGNCVYRKSVLQACGGFHPDGMPNHLLMYRGDGESYVREYILEHKMKAMYCAQASIYHLIDADRVTDSYIKYMYFRSGISYMYTNLRANGIKSGIIKLILDMLLTLRRKESIYTVLGGAYLCAYYFFYKRVRDWVHKEDYF